MLRCAARIARPVLNNTPRVVSGRYVVYSLWEISAKYSHRAFSSTQLTTSQACTSLHTFTEEEGMFREAGNFSWKLSWKEGSSWFLVRRFANDVVGPKVREMDENEMMDKSIVAGLFEQGVRPSCSQYCSKIDNMFIMLSANGHRNKC